MNLLAKTGLIGLGVVGIILLAILLFAFGTAIAAFFVALIWNWIGLHALFGASALTFWQCVGIGAALNFIGGLFSRPTITTGG